MSSGESATFPDDTELIDYLMEQIHASAGDNFEEVLAANIKTGVQTATFQDNITPGMDYVIATFGCTTTGTATTAVVRTSVTTESIEKIDCTFELSVSVNGPNATVAVKPSVSDVEWFPYAVPKSIWESVEDIYTKDSFIAGGLEEAVAYGTADQAIGHGEGTINLSGLTANRDYILFIAAQDEYCIISDAQTVEFTTGDPIQVNLTFDITVDNITQTTADLTIKVNNPNLPYMSRYERTEVYEGRSDEEIIQALVNSSAGNQSTQKGNYTYTYPDLIPGTSYTVYAFGYEGGPTTGLTKYEFVSKDGGDPQSCTFEVKYSNIGSDQATVSIEPSDPAVYYDFKWMTTAEFEATNEETLIEEYMQVHEENVQANHDFGLTDFSIYDSLLSACTAGSTPTYILQPLEAETSYTGIVFVLDIKNAQVAKLATSSFTTTSGKPLAAEIELLSQNYFNGSDVLSLYPTSGVNSDWGCIAIKVDQLAATTYPTLKFGHLKGGDFSYGTADHILHGSHINWQTIDADRPIIIDGCDANQVITIFAYGETASGEVSGISSLVLTTPQEYSAISELEEILNEYFEDPYFAEDPMDLSKAPKKQQTKTFGLRGGLGQQNPMAHRNPVAVQNQTPAEDLCHVSIKLSEGNFKKRNMRFAVSE